MKCNFCGKDSSILQLVHHLSGGASCACPDCLKDPKYDIRKLENTKGGYYTK